MFNPILFRHQLHRIPELSGSETKTHNTIAETLRSFGFFPIEGIGGHGVVLKIDSGIYGPHLLFRANIDALPIHEIMAHHHVSNVDGVMHASGHDGHTASLMALACRLSQFKLQSGSVTLIFQPSEENGEGALAMLRDNNWKKGHIDYAFGYHNVPGYPLGQILCRENTFACASSCVSIFLKGKTAQAAYPENAINPSSAIKDLMHSIELIPSDIGQGLTIVTILHVNVDQPTFRTTPEICQLMAVLRSDSNKYFEALCDRVKQLSKYYAERDGLELDVIWTDRFNATINHSEANMLLKQACKDLGFGFTDLYQPMRWSEDFSAYSKKWPSAFFGLGSGLGHPPLHDPHYDFPDTLIDISSKIFEQIIRDMNGVQN